MKPVQLGIIGCGNISDAYFNGAARSSLVKVKACADVRTEAAQAKADQHGVQALSVQALLADPEIEIVINLTIPDAHAPVATQVLDAGKHVYLEKPLSAKLSDAQKLVAHASAKGLRVGCAPDTFFGAGHQATRRAIDTGRIGKPVAGCVAVMGHGAESWHPNPEFFYKPGGGPMLDMGPYYLTALVNMLGPMTRLTGCATRAASMCADNVLTLRNTARNASSSESSSPTLISTPKFSAMASAISSASIESRPSPPSWVRNNGASGDSVAESMSSRFKVATMICASWRSRSLATGALLISIRC